jgi:hypothetical protein
VDEQFYALLEQRRKIEEELRSLQNQINEEFERVTQQEQSLSRALGQIVESAKAAQNANGNGKNHNNRRFNVVENG